MQQSFDTSSPNTKQPSLAVVLGSAGTRAFAALPFLQLLDEQGLRADLVIGCGGGALIAALWSAGYSLDQIIKIFTRHFSREAYESVSSDALNCLISERGSTEGIDCWGLYNPVILKRAYEIIFKDMLLEDFKTPTLLYATDINTGEGVCLAKGLVATAVEASGAYYPIMPPVERDGLLLANGAIASPLPVMEAVKQNIELILTVHLEDAPPQNPKNFLESAMAVNRLTSQALRRAQLFAAIDMHDYEICIAEVNYAHPVMPWDVEHIPGILLEAKGTAKRKIPELQRLRKDFSRRKAAEDATRATEQKSSAAGNQTDKTRSGTS